jgi:phosphoribosylglycinamide formyltransferase-1
MSKDGPLKLAVLISGRGSNMAAIAQAAQTGRIAARIVLVLSDRAQAAGLATAQEWGLATAAIERASYPAREDFERALLRAIDACGAEWVALAGFMRILSADCVRHFEGRVLNIHPSLLPRHKGLHTHRRVIESGDPLHGCSVHLVTPELDGGPVIAQASVAVLPEDTEESLAARVLQQEHRLYPMVIGLIANGRLRIEGAQALLDGHALAQPLSGLDEPGLHGPGLDEPGLDEPGPHGSGRHVAGA